MNDCGRTTQKKTLTPHDETANLAHSNGNPTVSPERPLTVEVVNKRYPKYRHVIWERGLMP